MTARRLSGLGGLFLLAAAVGCREQAPAASAESAAAGSETATASGKAAPPVRPDAEAEYGLSGAPAWQVRLPAELHEISGMAVTEDGRVFAHGDEDATIYQIDPRAGTIAKRFSLAPTGDDPDLGKKGRGGGKLTGDFEDIAVDGDRFFLVTSNGVLVEFAEGADGAAVPYEAHPTPLRDVCEVEGLAHDPAKGSLLVLCKTMEDKSERDQVAVYEWSLDRRSLAETPRFTIPWSELAPTTGGKGFNGSAITVRPGSESLFLTAGPQRLFAEVTEDGKPVRGGAFTKDTQPQPESMAFLPDGTLLVASEGGKGVATLAGYSAR